MRRAAGCAALWLMPLYGLLAQTPAPSRWSMYIRTPVTTETAELRLQQGSGLILLQSADSAFRALDSLQITSAAISFRIRGDQRRFRATITPLEMDGTFTGPGGAAGTWTASLIRPGFERWPVPPRVTVSQIVVGSADSVTVIPAAWRAALPPASQLRVEADSLARAAGLINATRIDVSSITLGLDSTVRSAVLMSMQALLRNQPSNSRLRGVFVDRAGRVRTDMISVAMGFAASVGGLDLAAANRALRKMGVAPIATDTFSVGVAAWHFANALRFDGEHFDRRPFAGLASDSSAFQAATVLLNGIEYARSWWRDAVLLLMRERWIDTPSGLVSPVQAMQQFWGDTTLRLPRLEMVGFGTAQAVPTPAIALLGNAFIVGRNASAREWLTATSNAPAIDAWHTVGGADVRAAWNGGTAVVSSPETQHGSRLSGFYSSINTIRIEPQIMPLFAVSTVMHEWMHLVIEQLRSAPRGGGVSRLSTGIRIVDPDPWLSEGLAEFGAATALAPLARQLPLVLLADAAKRAALSDDDPHALGYRMMRASRLLQQSALPRTRLAAVLHDAGAAARLLQHAGPVAGTLPMRLSRPATLTIIPEVTFTWDQGALDHVVQRLRLSHSPLEP